MIEKSVYEDYEIKFSDTYTSDDAYYFIFNENRELLLKDKELITDISELNFNFSLYIGKYKDKDCFVVNSDFKQGYDLIDVYEFNKDLYLMGTKAVLVNDWYISHQYCGRCGTIRNRDKLLMAQHSYHETIRYALIAGFVEPGESIEEAVHREVSEEVGIKIKNLKYLKSQSWPFPNSLMLAFEAEYASGEIKVDGDEIVKAKWFKKDEIIRYSSDISISDWLIQNFIDNN